MDANSQANHTLNTSAYYFLKSVFKTMNVAQPKHDGPIRQTMALVL